MTRVKYGVSILYRDCPIKVDVDGLNRIPLGTMNDFDVNSAGVHFTFQNMDDIPYVMSRFADAFGVKSYAVDVCHVDDQGRCRWYYSDVSTPILDADELYSRQVADWAR